MTRNIDKVIILYFILFIPQHAYAYVEPGSASIVLQIIIAGFVGLLVAFRGIWNSLLKMLFKILKKN